MRSKRRGRPRGSRLKPWQAAQIARLVIHKTPEQLRLPFFLWTREAVQALIEERCQVRVSVWTVGRYLARWGFTPQKPVRQAFERDPEAVRRWLEKEYPAIQAEAKRLRVRILWVDEMGLRSDHAAGTTYSRKGVTPVIPGTGKRFGCNMVSAISNRGKLYFMVFKGTFDARVLQKFLKRLMRQIETKVFLILVILDRHPVHRSAAIRRFLHKNGNRIRLVFLPCYSPHLNLGELLNQDAKGNAIGRRRSRDQFELIKSVRSFLFTRKRQLHRVRAYFRECHVQYAA